MAIYRFRISFEEYDDIYRDIEIRSVQSFEQFHLAIQEAIGFDASKPATFYMSNDLWKKGQEIVFQKTEKTSGEARLMKSSRLCDFIADPHQKIYYVFDQPSQWTFFIELFKILPETEITKKYPVCVKVHGDAPKQYMVVEAPKGVLDPEFMDDELFGDGVLEEGTDDVEEGEDAPAIAAEFSEEVDEAEYDNIEESSEEEGEKE
ncbi:MAG: plasmid pRiA4b ORF-3 family protein [Bacteroidota bacterium]|nr:plasmid pRiA4b ORF-3 family protein [Bacteroidota bacterium]